MVREKLVIPVILAMLVGVTYYNQHQGIAARAREGKVAHDALCALREGLEQDIQNSVLYLKDHPNGAPALGLSATYIQSQIDDRKARVEAINSAGLEC